MSKQGGYRPGAGRKRGSKNKLPKGVAEAKERYRQHIFSVFDKLLDAKLKLALGTYVEKPGPGRTAPMRIYTTLPNNEAINDLIHFVTGKPKIVDDEDDGLKDPESVNTLETLSNNVKSILLGKLPIPEPPPVDAEVVKPEPEPKIIIRKTVMNFTPLPKKILKTLATDINPMKVLKR